MSHWILGWRLRHIYSECINKTELCWNLSRELRNYIKHASCALSEFSYGVLDCESITMYFMAIGTIWANFCENLWVFRHQLKTIYDDGNFLPKLFTLSNRPYALHLCACVFGKKANRFGVVYLKDALYPLSIIFFVEKSMIFQRHRKQLNWLLTIHTETNNLFLVDYILYLRTRRKLHSFAFSKPEFFSFSLPTCFK